MAFRIDPVNGLLEGIRERLLVVRVQLATETLRVSELGLEAVDIGGKGIEGFDALLLGFVFGGELLGLDDHAVNFLWSKTSLLVRDGDRFGFTGTLVSGGDLHDTVGVDLERNLDLRNATRSGRNAGELKLAEEVVVLGEGTFTLEDLDQDRGLVVGSGGENLTLAGRDNGVTGNKLGHDATSCFDTEGERVNIDKEKTTQTLVAGEDTSLDSSTVGDSLIRVDSLGGFLSKVLLEELLDLGDTGGTTDKNNLRNI